MTTLRSNITIYDEEEMVKAIKKYQKKEELSTYTLACTKLVKKGLRAEGLLGVPKI